MGYRITPSAQLLAMRKRLQESLGANDDTGYDREVSLAGPTAPAEEPDPEKLPSGPEVPPPQGREVSGEDTPQFRPGDSDEETATRQPSPPPQEEGDFKPQPLAKTEKDYLPTDEDINSYYDDKGRGNIANAWMRMFGGGPENGLLRKKALLENYQERQRSQNREELSSPDSMESKLARVKAFKRLSEMRDLASQKGDTEAFSYYDELLKGLPKMSANQLQATASGGGSRKPNAKDDLLDFGEKDDLAQQRANTAERNAGTSEKRNDIREDQLALGVGKQVNFNPVSTQLQKQKVRINAALQRLAQKGTLDESALSDIEADYAAALAGTGVFSNYKLQQLKQPSFMRDLQKMHRYFANGPIDLRTTSPQIVAQVKSNLENLSRAFDGELGRVAEINRSMHFKTKGAQDTLNSSVEQFQQPGKTSGKQKSGNVDGQNVEQVRAWVSDPKNAQHPNYKKWKGWLDSHGG